MVRSRILLLLVFLTALPTHLSAQSSTVWQDPSPHKVQFVTVDKDVKLEVLDWGGTGRPLVLLTGLGNTAHVFDDFAPKLSSEFHVIGITRRGFGASSHPASGYSADRLGDDVLAAMDALKLERPILVGHSIAGEELSSVATRHPERIAGVVYLEASYWYAYYHRSVETLPIDLEQLLRKLDQLQPGLANFAGKSPAEQRQLVEGLLRDDLPTLETDLRDWQNSSQSALVQPAPPPLPGPDDLDSFAAFRSWNKRITGIAYPEAEYRQQRQTRQDGGVGGILEHYATDVMAGEQRYSDIRVPVLAIYALPHDLGPTINNDPVGRKISKEVDESAEKELKAFEAGTPGARVVRLANANHYVFISNEADVLREMKAFISTVQ